MKGYLLSVSLPVFKFSRNMIKYVLYQKAASAPLDKSNAFVKPRPLYVRPKAVKTEHVAFQ